MLRGRFAQGMELLSLLFVLVGIGALCQPWWFAVYRVGFPVLLAGVIGLTVFSHRSPVR